MSTRLTVGEAKGAVGDLLEKLAGDEGKEWLRDLKRFLRKEPCWGPPEFNPWRPLTLGLHKTADLYREALTQAGFKISEWALHILGKPQFTVATEETEVELVVVTVGDLGFPKGAILEQIYTRAKQHGLKLCPPEVGPALRLQYPDQPLGEWLLIAMEPITGPDGSPYVFCVGHGDSGRWLRESGGFPRGCWNADCCWVFLRK